MAGFGFPGGFQLGLGEVGFDLRKREVAVDMIDLVCQIGLEAARACPVAIRVASISITAVVT